MAQTHRASIRDRFKLRWPDRQRLDLARVVWSYRRDSDTLMIDLFGRGRPALSVPLDLGERDYLFVRVDVDTEEIVGFQIEDFLAYAIKQHPDLVTALTFAELDGITPAEVAAVQQAVAPASRGPQTVASVYDKLINLVA